MLLPVIATIGHQGLMPNGCYLEGTKSTSGMLTALCIYICVWCFADMSMVGMYTHLNIYLISTDPFTSRKFEDVNNPVGGVSDPD